MTLYFYYKMYLFDKREWNKENLISMLLKNIYIVNEGKKYWEPRLSPKDRVYWQYSIIKL